MLHLVTQLELGGAQSSTLAILAQLDRRKFIPSLVSSHGPLTHAARAIRGLSVTLVPGLRSAVNPFKDLWAFSRLVSLIRQGGYQIVHTHSSKAGILARWAAHLAKIPVIVHTIHGFGFHAFQPRWLSRLYQRFERDASRVTGALVAVSERDRKTGLALGIGTPDRYRLIRYGIEPSQFFPHSPASIVRQELGLDPRRPVIGTVACLKPQKAPLDFVRACQLIRHALPETQFIIAGDGSMRPEVERLRDELGLNGSLHLLGWRHDIPRLLSAMDVFMLASRWEGLPIACIEAMALGLPIVATTAGGIPELVKDGRNGFLVPVSQPARLAGAALRILRDDALRHEMGAASRGMVDSHFTVEHMVRETERLYEDLLEKRMA